MKLSVLIFFRLCKLEETKKTNLDSFAVGKIQDSAAMGKTPRMPNVVTPRVPMPLNHIII